ncbi:beta-ketoacyl synthase N-terminal-like domain-containing protein [Streptosporangium sp. NPDC001559]|uniref:beta-ketoacyl synthase N-terminal-like domain-containing protein n=1 Tax=Streptosporangium sp. NPDC001559 TaxID=3366187 RepID=UPI0036E5A732
MTDAAVAIIGMSGRFPGASDLAAFWANLCDGVCSITDFSEEELRDAGVGEEELRNPAYVPSKGYLAGADRFEAELFGFNPAEAVALDPQHRQLLETAWSALEDAGHDPRRPPRRTGVYVGGGLSEHMIAAHADPGLAARYGAMHLRVMTDREFLAGWISYRLGLDGPSLTVQTACATSLTAVHLAAQALLLGECDTALAGGVSIDSVRRRGYLYRSGGIFSPDGRCRPFDEKAAGTVPGNGVGLVVLRRLEDAAADGDPIRAVIRGSAITNDGSAKVGFTAPSVDRQAAAIVEAWAAAGLDPAQAHYLETHGTATELGDRIEIASASAAFAGAGHCLIGSVKSNLGHLDTAAGVAGLIKTVLMLENRTLVPSANVIRPHPDLRLQASPFDLVTAVSPWTSSRGTRRAGITSVGIGGTNVHVAVEEWAGGRPAIRTRVFAGASYGAFSLAALTSVPSSAPALANTGHLQDAVTGLLSVTLGLTRAEDLDKTYLAVGGDSLTAVFLIGRMRDDFDLDVPVTLFLEKLTLREIAERIVRPEENLLTSLLDELEG